MLGSWGFGGDELSGVRVDVVEVLVVVVLVVGVVRRHLFDAGRDARHRLHVRLWGCPAPGLPPFDPPSPPGSHALSCLSLGACGNLALALGPPSGPDASVPLPVPSVTPPVNHALACLLALPAPLPPIPVPWPLPGSLPCVAPSAARAPYPSAAAGLGAPSVFAPLLLASCALARSLRVPLTKSPVASRFPAPRSRGWHAAPPARHPLLPGSRAGCPAAFAAAAASRPAASTRAPGGRTCRVRPGGKGLGGHGLGGLVWVWVGLAWARYFAPSLPTAAAAAAAGEAPVARAGAVPRFRGVLGPAAWPAEAVARLAGAALATPRAPSPLPSAAAAALGDAPGSCAGATPRVGGVPGAAVGAAAWLAGAAVSAPRASGAPSRGGAAGLAVWAAGAVTSAGSGSSVDGPVSAGAARGCLAGGPTGTAASATHRSSRSAGVSPAPSGTERGAGVGLAEVAVILLGGSHRSLTSLLSW